MSKIIGTTKENKILVFKDDKLALCLKKEEIDGFDVYEEEKYKSREVMLNNKYVIENYDIKYIYHIRIHKKNYSFVIDIDNEEDFNEYISILSKSI